MKNVFHPREVSSDLLLLCPVLVCVIEPASAAQVSSEVGNSFPRMNRAFILPKSVPTENTSVLASGAGYFLCASSSSWNSLKIQDDFFPSLFCLRV